jgi:hypothetical protein
MPRNDAAAIGRARDGTTAVDLEPRALVARLAAIVPTPRLHITLSANKYTPGDFSGDQKSDLIITNASGSYWYFSNGDGTFTQSYTRPDLIGP